MQGSTLWVLVTKPICKTLLLKLEIQTPEPVQHSPACFFNSSGRVSKSGTYIEPWEHLTAASDTPSSCSECSSAGWPLHSDRRGTSVIVACGLAERSLGNAARPPVSACVSARPICHPVVCVCVCVHAPLTSVIGRLRQIWRP